MRSAREQLQQSGADRATGAVDLAWSRDVARKTYVQDVLLQQAETLKSWVAATRPSMCGSLQGMGQGVHQALKQVLGEEQQRLTHVTAATCIE